MGHCSGLFQLADISHVLHTGSSQILESSRCRLRTIRADNTTLEIIQEPSDKAAVREFDALKHGPQEQTGAGAALQERDNVRTLLTAAQNGDLAAFQVIQTCAISQTPLAFCRHELVLGRR